MTAPEFREAVKDFVHAVEIGDMSTVAMRQLDALEAITRILADVADHEAGPEDTDYGRGYIAGQHALTRKLLEAIQREVQG